MDDKFEAACRIAGAAFGLMMAFAAYLLVSKGMVLEAITLLIWCELAAIGRVLNRISERK